MKLLSWNVNGLRACAQKGFLRWLEQENADFVGLQETKAHPDQITAELRNPTSYQSIWDSAEKRGYSGVATYLRHEPLSVQKGLGETSFDCEGRTLTVEYRDFFLINAYFPNGQRDHKRVPFKMAYCQAMVEHCERLRAKKEVIVCGDFNTAHQEIDLRNPKQNVETTGFLPIERAWIDHFIALGYVDIFRVQNPKPFQYTWWSYRPTVRERNIGWRIDYFFVSKSLARFVKRAYHQPHVFGSDHCPIGIELDATIS